MDFLDCTLGTASENLALDEALLLEAEAGTAGEVLRVWEWPALAVVLGSGCKLAEDVDADACQRDGVPILRRSSGGGTVLLGDGCLCYSLILAYERDAHLSQIGLSYAWILSRVLAAVGMAGAEQLGISDLAIDGRKFSGNAQQRKRHHVLHHGTLLYRMDLATVPRYLRQPLRQPDYREDRDHGAFIRNVELDRTRIIAGLRAEWGADRERGAWPEAEVARLVGEKYGCTAWTERR